MDDILLHPRSRAELSALLHDAPHALLLIAPKGTGKRTVAFAWGAALAKGTNITTLEPDEKGTISIEATRMLYRRARAKHKDRQVIIVDHAEAMSTEAQNAFLKLLEEPREGLTFILTATAPEDLLPTSLSRVQAVTLLPVGNDTLAAHAKNSANVPEQTLAQLLFVANGRPAAYAAMLADSTVFDHQKHIMQRAKQLVRASRYERLAMVQELSKDKVELVATLEAVARMVALQLQHTPLAQWVAMAEALQECLQRLRQNGNPRAQLVNLFLSY